MCLNLLVSHFHRVGIVASTPDIFFLGKMAAQRKKKIIGRQVSWITVSRITCVVTRKRTPGNRSVGHL